VNKDRPIGPSTRLLRFGILPATQPRLSGFFILPALIVSFWGALLACLPAAGLAAPSNMPDRLSIKLPDGSEMHFRAVYLGIDGHRLFASRRITLGSREPNPSYKERLTETLISGGFVGNRQGKQDWLYYLGETEVQRCQWNAVLRWADQQKGLPPRPLDDSKLPQTDLTVAEVYQFVEALNQWMLSQDKKNLPTFRGAMAFCRLPTEAEWEFAARGGIQVLENNPDTFDRPHPYGADPGNYEWYRSNSGNKVQECGSSNIKPNPLGLYDMLGNVEELTINLFSPEYQQGRFGDFVIRGCNFSSSEVSASRRSEYLQYEANGEPHRSKKVGFRLVLSSRVSAVQTTPEQLDGAFAEYVKSSGLTRPGRVGESSPADQAAQDRVHFMETQLARFKSEEERRSQEISRLQKELENKARAAAEAESHYQDLQDKLRRTEQALKNALNQTLDRAAHNQESLLRLQLEEARSENQRLAQQLAALQAKQQSEPKAVFADFQTDKDLADKLSRQEQEIADLKRRALLFDHEISKNASRVRAVEKRYLEALMRQASANAYIGWRILKKLELAAESGVTSRTDPKFQERLQEGSQMVSDYWALVVQIAEQTQADLFPEVKSELAAWLKAREKKDAAGWQRKALDLIDRHVRDVRAGRYHRPEDLVQSFPNEPEFN